MNDIKPNVTGYIEPILRLAGATFLVPVILYTEWMALIPVPFYVLVTVLGGYDPLKAYLSKRVAKKKSHTTRTRSKRVSKAGNQANSHDSLLLTSL